MISDEKKTPEKGNKEKKKRAAPRLSEPEVVVNTAMVSMIADPYDLAALTRFLQLSGLNVSSVPDLIEGIRQFHSSN